MAEGLADLGVQASIGEGWGPWAAEILGDLGLRFDGDLAERLAAAAAPLNRVRQDAAVMLHDRGAGTDEVVAYLQRWSLVSAERAAPADPLPHPPAVAGLHLHLRRGLRPAVALAGRPAGRPAGGRAVPAAARRAAHPARRGRRAAGGLRLSAPGRPGGAHARAVDGVVARRPPPGRAAVGGRPRRCSGRCSWSRRSGRWWPSARGGPAARPCPRVGGSGPRRCAPTPWSGRTCASRPDRRREPRLSPLPRVGLLGRLVPHRGDTPGPVRGRGHQTVTLRA